MNKKPATFTTFCGSLHISQSYLDMTTTMDVRRVKPESTGEHVQISISVEKRHEKRTTTASGYIELRPEDVQYLINALTKLHPPYEHRIGRSWTDKDSEDRAFYGLPEVAR